jgi:hypothetical protein
LCDLDKTTMNATIHYRIHVRELLADCWAEWLAPLVVHSTASGETMLVGALRDQAELFGLLVKVRDLNLTLLSVERLDTEGIAWTDSTAVIMNRAHPEQ